MLSADPWATGPAQFATFEILRVDGAAAATALADRIAGETTTWIRHLPGFAAGHVHISLDGTTVVHHLLWETEEAYRMWYFGSAASQVLAELTKGPQVLAATARSGLAAPGLSGPAAGEPPGIVAVATRHLGGRDSAVAVLELLARSGDWKRAFPGFISATPYVSQDGRTFVNYPMWTDEAAYRAWMADPRISEGQQEIARLETAAPEYLVCSVAARIGIPARAS
ncbi:putative quinol monooxygenase [Amycolatopsis pithecellobii]|uniref:ABM domain-containing protein n=1 Tax=Amycolatopsis pithecellobii TaxID=664692 RepID=A0A6N7YRC7_9PSEU|nr:antibiotic biosynthesis monooxygenase [Amycolatopsis pithecellobii]MTD54522.1 hypothetical protein [Amycolatopsis pithecellobii]